jgi:phage terminase small subunit
MPVLSNPRRERFAQELAKGETADAAYVAAGFKANRGNATRLKANESVVARVEEIQGRAAVRAEITVAGITDRLLAIATKAENSTEASMLQAARAALMDAAKLNGLVVDKKQVDGIGPVSVTYVTNGQPAPEPSSDEDYETD